MWWNNWRKIRKAYFFDCPDSRSKDAQVEWLDSDLFQFTQVGTKFDSFLQKEEAESHSW